MSKNNYVKSPLNYTGGKYKLLPQILPLFPKQINTFVDLFCGGGNVGVNITADKIIFNDINAHVIELLKWFNDNNSEYLIEYVENLIYEYDLTNTYEFGYEHYGCNSSDGVAKVNKESFLKLRDDYNKGKNDIGVLYALIVHAFNNKITFNKEGKFMESVNKRDFNKTIRNNLIKFSDALKKLNVQFRNIDYRDVPEILNLNSNDFVYVDPPYLITETNYNDNWHEKDEYELYHMLDYLNLHNIKFAVSNVTHHKGKQNDILIEWSKKYNIHNLNFDYKNCMHNGVKGKSVEVLITNY